MIFNISTIITFFLALFEVAASASLDSALRSCMNGVPSVIALEGRDVDQQKFSFVLRCDCGNFSDLFCAVLRCEIRKSRKLRNFALFCGMRKWTHFAEILRILRKLRILRIAREKRNLCNFADLLKICIFCGNFAGIAEFCIQISPIFIWGHVPRFFGF